MFTRIAMRKFLLTIPVLAATALLPAVGSAKGCIKGAAVGGVAGHVAGHHAVAGAAVGCVIGHHRAKVKDKAAAQQAAGQQTADQQNGGRAPAPQTQAAAPPH
jgi:hypothetical protein